MVSPHKNLPSPYVSLTDDTCVEFYGRKGVRMLRLCEASMETSPDSVATTLCNYGFRHKEERSEPITIARAIRTVD